MKERRPTATLLTLLTLLSGALAAELLRHFLLSKRPTLHAVLTQPLSLPTASERVQSIMIVNRGRGVATNVLIRVDFPRRSTRPDYWIETTSPPMDVARSDSTLRFTVPRLVPRETALVLLLVKAGSILPTDVSILVEDNLITGNQIEHITTRNGG